MMSIRDASTRMRNNPVFTADLFVRETPLFTAKPRASGLDGAVYFCVDYFTVNATPRPHWVKKNHFTIEP
jgi:hypothetical protein